MTVNTSVPSVAIPSLVTVLDSLDTALDQMQLWSDKYFSGKYRDAAETLLLGFILLVCCIAIKAYDNSKFHVKQAFNYWLAAAEHQFHVESGLWLELLTYELLPASQCFDECWTELAQQAVAAQQILAYEVASGAITAEIQ